MSRRIPQRAQAARARLHATDAQVVYVRRLLNEAFAARYEHGLCLDPHHLDNLTKEYASTAISTLKAARERGWCHE